MSKAFYYFMETRPNFLLLTVACVSVGFGTALLCEGKNISGWFLALALFGALAAHAAVDILNNYSDYTSGLDCKTTRTPFSGGSGNLPAKLLPPKGVLIFGIITLLVTVGIGLYFLYVRGLGLLLVGVPGVALIIFYTQYITRRPWMCLFAPGLGFGPCMVLGIHYVLTGSYSWVALVASVVPLLLVSNLLLLNQFPDAGPDKEVGRCHLPILFGLKKSAEIYCVILLACYLWIVISVALKFLPATALAALLVAPLAWMTGVRVLENAEDIPALVPVLGMNVAVTLITPVLLAVGLGLPVLLV